MPVCKKHMQNYSRGSRCPFCQNKVSRDQTPMWKIGGLRWPDIRGKRQWEKVEELPERNR